MDIAYRQAAPKDITHVAAVFSAAIDDLDKRHGFYEGPTPKSPPGPQYAFWLRKDPGSFWVAENNGRIVGYATSFLRGSLWFLAELFVRPSYQGKGVGRSLIGRTLGSWKGHGISNRALITPAFNRSSASLYMRFGLLPRHPLYFASVPREDIARRLGPGNAKNLKLEEQADPERLYRILDQIDRRALGFPLGWHHEFFLEVQRARCFVLRTNGRAEGYVYVRPNGRIGPLVVSSASAFRGVMEASLRIASEGESKEVTIFFAGSNREAASVCMEAGFRITYPLLFMSTRAVAWSNRYLFYSPGMM